MCDGYLSSCYIATDFRSQLQELLTVNLLHLLLLHPLICKFDDAVVLVRMVLGIGRRNWSRVRKESLRDPKYRSLPSRSTFNLSSSSLL